MVVEDLKLERIERPEDCPVVVHGTFKHAWEAISPSGWSCQPDFGLRFTDSGQEGLKIMKRHHIHCASGLYGDVNVVSGR